MSLPLKYRPKSFKEVLGNTAQVKALMSSIQSENPPHVFCLSGLHGLGKTTLARICAKELGAHSTGIHELNFSQNTGKDDAEQLITMSKYLPMQGKVSVFICDEFHRLSAQGQDSLLKLFEEGPDHAYFFICTTDPQKLRPAIRSRAFGVELRPLNKKTVEQLLGQIINKEGLEHIPEAVISEIAINSGGSARDALQLLEKASLLESEEDMLDAVESVGSEDSNVYELYRALIGSGTKWKEITTIIDKLRSESNAESIRYALRNMAMGSLLKKSDVRAAMIIETMSDPFDAVGFPDLTVACFKLNRA